MYIRIIRKKVLSLVLETLHKKYFGFIVTFAEKQSIRPNISQRKVR